MSKTKTPQTLYSTCLNCYVSSLNYNVQQLDNASFRLLLPPAVLADIYFKVSKTKKSHLLSSKKKVKFLSHNTVVVVVFALQPASLLVS
jgi:hypothetical protein